MLQQMCEVTATPSTQQCRVADVCAIDRQRRRSLLLKAVKVSSATRQHALGVHRLI